jgi:hypothetical protein
VTTRTVSRERLHADGLADRGRPRPDLAAEYGLDETVTASYAERTERSVQLADGTVVFGDRASPGSMGTDPP